MGKKYVNRVKDALENTWQKSYLSELDAVSDDDIIKWLWNKCARNARFFLENFTKLPIPRKGPTRWKFNRPQATYFDRTHTWIDDDRGYAKTVRQNFVLKARQYGGTSEEIGEIYHDDCFLGLSYVGKVITFEDLTASKLKKILDTMHSGAIEIFTDLGFDPYEFIPFVPFRENDATFGNKHEFESDDTGSVIEFTTQGGKGSGRSLTVSRQYWTEYSKWDRTSDAKAGFLGSMVQDGTAVHTIDGTGQGIGNSFYGEYQKAKAGESAYMSHFFGIHDHDYSPQHLADERAMLGPRLFKQEFPETDDDAFLRGDNTFFDPDLIKARSADKYLCDLLPYDELMARVVVISVDCAGGFPNSDYSVIKIRDLESGHETRPPIRKRMGPREIANRIKALFDDGFVGVIAVERDAHGEATILELQNLGLGSYLYRHREPNKELSDCKIGWPETRHRSGGGTKPRLEVEYDRQLDSDWLVVVSENERIEARQYCRHENGETGAPKGTDDEGDRFYDDEIIASMIGIMPEVRAQALRFGKQQTESHSVAVGSMWED
jgi:hypothetical protein